jgi:hypothetical protein
MNDLGWIDAGHRRPVNIYGILHEIALQRSTLVGQGDPDLGAINRIPGGLDKSFLDHGTDHRHCGVLSDAGHVIQIFMRDAIAYQQHTQIVTKASLWIKPRQPRTK